MYVLYAKKKKPEREADNNVEVKEQCDEDEGEEEGGDGIELLIVKKGMKEPTCITILFQTPTHESRKFIKS